ncbi:class I SAM-dependent methyltransferase [Heyndrickxia ginsengihumi]|uniref:class I SAM-dependent methyltransferase n=1 Tax=Heyndrickxia ginsengihumi TaxID=363870 RepID=UPI001D3149B9|nr:class I SAM-dependent methyltransferase [Heyndrickxia ginsengihumi]MBE6184757.1 class I SAM-dependent methyltransferase [Bacillus sp. (in: firmicutes)]MCM3023387.1 class I SAM-dependent methyltransferase [Heyndrickxia ginsengihumi]
MENIDKFNGKAETYEKFRPSYPEELIKDLIAEHSLDQHKVVADIGSGTGMMAKALLDHHVKVIAVEPNDDMRRIAEERLHSNPLFTAVNGTAEQTTLKSNSVDLITVAQAFHWFDPEQFKKECQRILKPNRKVILVWNRRVTENQLIQETITLYKKYCPNFHGFSEGIEQNSDIYLTFFRNENYQFKSYDHPLYYNIEGFIGRHLSASYAPKPDDQHFHEFIEAFSELFHKYSKDGIIMMPHVTHSYSGNV